MARPREFDIDLAIDQAMQLFWRKGFEATSLQDLLGELGIGRGSMYAAFHSKEQLYARALERYCSQHVAELLQRLDASEAVRPALHQALCDMVDADLAEPDRGCLLVNAATERGSHDPTVSRVGSTMRLLESAMAEALVRARLRGELAADKDPVELARFFTTFVQGLRVMGKARAGRAFVEDALAVALRALD